jgi:hypothetical protein
MASIVPAEPCDAGALTVLLPDSQPGLEFHHGGSCHTVFAAPGARVINVGDVVQVWSNDRYRPINWGEFRAGRAAGDYADMGREIRISDFRL